MTLIDSYLKEIEKELIIKPKTYLTHEVGEVVEIKDGIIFLTGLDHVGFGEIISLNNNISALVIDLTPERVGAIVLGNYLSIKSGDLARSTGNTLSIPVSNELIGRVINPLSQPLDDRPLIEKKVYYPIERPPPSVVERERVNTPLHTGIKAIDALIPIGRGQRELIIGDRGTGKTTIAIDTILSQKNTGVVCIYCAIGQKNSKIAQTIELLRQRGALSHSIIVASPAADVATLQYLAPYSATAIAEYFMDQGKDVLIVYDDLSKHAWAYRQISLILCRPAGREAYPGDVFYLHSRLLERAAKRSNKFGGGSITALPIIETLEGDVSAYIPTNVISITDGQIVLDVDLFNAGIRPAINIGLSVSRVGGAAQSKAMKQVAGKLKLNLAQYRELSAFSQFESDLDKETKSFLKRGARVMQILKQDKHSPFDLASEVGIIWTANNGYLDDLELDYVAEFEQKFLRELSLRGGNLSDKIRANAILDKTDEEFLKKIIEDNLLVKPQVSKEI